MVALIELIQAHPRTAIIIMSFIITLFVTIINSLIMDKNKMKEIKEKQKKLREEMKKYKNEPAKVMELNKQMMADLPEQMKQSFKPMLITIIPIIIAFGWLRSTFAITVIAKTWFWYYLIASIIFSMILRKLFKLQ